MMAKKKKTLKDYTAVGSLSADWILGNFPFVLFLSFLTILYIANAHYAEKQMRLTQEYQKEVDNLKRQHQSLESSVNHDSKFSKVAESVYDLGLKTTARKPKKIQILD